MDERDLIEYDTPRTLAEVFPHLIDGPEDRRRCSACGSQAQALPASALTVIKRHHESHPAGHLLLYCQEHLAKATEGNDASGGAGEKPGKIGRVCRNCFLVVPFGTGVCDACGDQAAPE